MRDLITDFTLNSCLFGSVKNADLDKYKYSGYGIGFGSRSEFPFSDESVGENVISFGADMSSVIWGLLAKKWGRAFFKFLTT